MCFYFIIFFLSFLRRQAAALAVPLPLNPSSSESRSPTGLGALVEVSVSVLRSSYFLLVPRFLLFFLFFSFSHPFFLRLSLSCLSCSPSPNPLNNLYFLSVCTFRVFACDLEPFFNNSFLMLVCVVFGSPCCCSCAAYSKHQLPICRSREETWVEIALQLYIGTRSIISEHFGYLQRI